ncbi:hypothetical protein Golob_017662 [Gossypium lobatum]|uniref:Aminotransferase-like plant mobile domain-containing protein n=1 Tax=Gossypium lobatum TaxID=34289 RepID=A0A7J8M7W5_9ROSI|nr:hypothetical protein [Gossypium lobatum]
MIYRGRIEMNWLRRNFVGLDDDLIEVEREQQTRAYILHIIRGILIPDKSQTLVHLRWLLKLIDFRGAGELSWGFVVLAVL